MVSRERIRPLLTATAKILLVLLLLYAFWQQLGSVNLAEVSGLLRGLGLSTILILIPYAIVIGFDALGWRSCITGNQNISFGQLFFIRLSTDAVMNTFPLGVAFAETLRPWLLRSRFGVPMTEAVSATMLSKINIAAMQVLFIALGLGFAFLAYDPSSGPLQLLSTPGALGWTLTILALLMLVAVLPYSGSMLTRISRLLQRLPIAFLRRKLHRIHEHLEEVDSYVSRFRRQYRKRLLYALSFFLLSWLTMALETWLLLSLLGTGLGLGEAIMLEVILSVIKLLVFFVPSALGAQEIGIVTVISAFGIPEAAVVSAAFILLRRGKEVLWYMTGLSALFYFRINPLRPALMKA